MIKEIMKEAKRYFINAPPTHDWSHVMRVYNLCMRIGKEENADLEVLKIAALLHDIAREKETSDNLFCHAKEGAIIARGILKKYCYNKIDEVCHCIETHRFRSNNPPISKEAKILYDADKLDAIGAIGVCRAYSFAGENKQRLYSEIPYDCSAMQPVSHDTHTPVIEFAIKLSKIKEKLLTKTGKKLAEERHEFMVNFFKRLDEEVKGIK